MEKVEGCAKITMIPKYLFRYLNWEPIAAPTLHPVIFTLNPNLALLQVHCNLECFLHFVFVQNFSFHLAAQRNREVNKLVTSQNFDYKWLEQIYFLVCCLIIFKLTSFWLLPTFAPSVQVLQRCFARGQGRARLLWQISPIIGAIKIFELLYILSAVQIYFCSQYNTMEKILPICDLCLGIKSHLNIFLII